MKPDWHGIDYHPEAVKKHIDFDSETRLKKCEKQLIVGVRYVATLGADLRLARAIDLLLSSAAMERKGSINDEKEAQPPRNSSPSEAMEINDGSQINRKKTRTP